MAFNIVKQNMIEENICKSVEILVKKYIADAKIDKVINARIVKCVDEDKGIYKCKYQDATFNAASNLPIEFKYEKDATVYILIPQGDFSNKKLILGIVR